MTVKAVGSTRRLVTTSVSIAVQLPIAARSSSTGVKASPPTWIVPPRALCTVYRPTESRSILTDLKVSSAMPPR